MDGRGRQGLVKLRLPPEPELIRLRYPDREPTVSQRWKFRRALVMYYAHRVGCSHRFLADVFDLPHSRVSGILSEFDEFLITSNLTTKDAPGQCLDLDRENKPVANSP